MWRVDIGNAVDDLDVFAFHCEGANALDVFRLRCALKERGMDRGRRIGRGFGKRIACDQIVPLGQRRRKDGLVESKMLATKLRDRGDDLLPVQSAANDGVAAVDVGRHVFKSRLGKLFAERLDWQVRFPADAAEK